MPVLFKYCIFETLIKKQHVTYSIIIYNFKCDLLSLQKSGLQKSGSPQPAGGCRPHVLHKTKKIWRTQRSGGLIPNNLKKLFSYSYNMLTSGSQATIVGKFLFEKK
jgi:hypothetical protein